MDIIGGVIDTRQMLEMSLGDRVVWPTTKPEVVITLGATSAEQYQARDQLRDAIYASGRHYSTVKTLPFTVVLGGTGYASELFRGCTSLTSVPDMDTSNVTDMQNMFSNCSQLTTVPDMDTSNVTNMRAMFIGCHSLTTVPDMDTGNVTDMYTMFQSCISLAVAPAMDTRNVTDMQRMFRYCSNLTSVPDMVVSQSPDMRNMFQGCTVLYDGSVRLLRDTLPSGWTTTNMIASSGLTRLPFYTFDGTPLP